MAIQHVTNEYHIPRGRVLFDPFDANGALTGESEFGNCPSFSISIATTKAEHFSSETGLKQKDAAVTVEVNRTAKIECDNISAAVLANFLSGSVETVSQASGSVTNEAITVIPGRQYQIGQSPSNPAGARNISAVTVTNVAGTTTYVENTDYLLDLNLGRLQILETGTIVASIVHVDYTRAAKTWSRIKTGAVAELSGAIRVVADNASGANRDFYMPKVNLTPEGDLPVIAEGTDFVKVAFSVEILKPANAEALYVDGRPVA